MKVLITGGAGFIGANLAERLLGDGHEVCSLDNFYSSSPGNIEHLKSYPGFTVMTHDIAEPIREIGHFDRIYNLACPASPPWYQKDPLKTIATNIEGAMNVLEFARKTGARVLQASTSEVYGDPLENPQKEDYRGNVNTLGPRACYDEGKRLAETIFMEYKRLYGVEVRIVRIFNTYGPRMAPDDGRVVSNFILQALQNKPITVYGEGKQTRSFQYITDLMDGCIALMENEGATGPVNIGNPGEFTVLELAEKVIRATGSSSTIVHEALPEDDPRQRKPDISLATELLGWFPKVGLDEGLEKTIAYFKGSLDTRS